MAPYDMMDPREYRFDYSPTPSFNMQVPQGFTPKMPSFDARSLLGPVSQTMFLGQGLLDAFQMFSASKNLKAQAGQYRMMGQQALEQGIETGRDIAHEGQEVKGEMLATFGKSGTLLEGSPLLVLADTQTEIERNIARALEQARIQKAAFDWQAQQAEKAARGGLLGGIAKVAGVVAAPFTGGASLGLTAAAWG